VLSRGLLMSTAYLYPTGFGSWGFLFPRTEFVKCSSEHPRMDAAMGIVLATDARLELGPFTDPRTERDPDAVEFGHVGARGTAGGGIPSSACPAGTIPLNPGEGSWRRLKVSGT
jgi:hypothetical protein